MTALYRKLALLLVAAALAATASVTDASAKPEFGRGKGPEKGNPPIVCIRAPCNFPSKDRPKYEHGHKPDIVCVRAPCPSGGGRDRMKLDMKGHI